MAFNKIDITTEWQEVLPTDDVAIWCPKLANINFATGETSPETTGIYDLLLAGLKNKLFIKAGASLWVRTQNENGSFLYYSPEIISGAGGSSSGNDGLYEFTIDGDNTADANDVQIFYRRYTKNGNTILPVLTIRFVPTSANPQIAFAANFSTGIFAGDNSAGGPVTVQLIGDPADDNADGKVFSIDGTSSIGIALSTPGFDGAKGYEVSVACSYTPANLPPVPAFIAVWDTTENGDNPDNATIALPLVELGEYDFYINWGDGNIDHITAWDQPETSHTYASPGTYTTQCRGTITGWNFRQNYTTPFCLKDITQWGCLLWDNGNYNGGYFYDTEYMTAITASDVPDLTGVNSFNQAFWDSAIVTINNLELWTFSAITDMEEAFKWCWQLNDPNLNYLDVSNVTTFRATFYGCQSLNVPLNLWSTVSANDMGYMLFDAESFNQSLNTFNMHSVETIEFMLASCPSFNNDIYLWHLPNCRNASHFISNSDSFNKNFVTTGYWDTPQCEDFSGFLLGSESFNMPLDLLDVSACKYFDEMVRQTLFNQPLPSWSTSNALSFYGTFRLTPFDQDISNFDFSNGPGLGLMFYQSGYNQPFTNDVSACSHFDYLFAAGHFNQDVSGMDMSNAISINGIFSDNPYFNQPFGMWNTALCQSMYAVLANATSFDQDIGGLNITSATDLTYFLHGVTMSTANYNSTLHGFDLQFPPYNLVFDGGNSKYDGIGAISRALLVSSYNWTITDGGPA